MNTGTRGCAFRGPCEVCWRSLLTRYKTPAGPRERQVQIQWKAAEANRTTREEAAGLRRQALPRGRRRVGAGGRVWVCVGTEAAGARRLEVEADYLNHPLFEDLLQLSVPEFGYSYEGALRVACDIDFFLHLLDLLRGSDRDAAVHYVDLRDLMADFYVSRGCRRPAAATAPIPIS